MNKAHLYLLARLYDVREADLISTERMAKALVRTWERDGLQQDYICRYTGISPHTYAGIYNLAGRPLKTNKPGKAQEREAVHAS